MIKQKNPEKAETLLSNQFRHYYHFNINHGSLNQIIKLTN